MPTYIPYPIRADCTDSAWSNRPAVPPPAPARLAGPAPTWTNGPAPVRPDPAHLLSGNCASIRTNRLLSEHARYLYNHGNSSHWILNPLRSSISIIAIFVFGAAIVWARDTFGVIQNVMKPRPNPNRKGNKNSWWATYDFCACKLFSHNYTAILNGGGLKVGV